MRFVSVLRPSRRKVRSSWGGSASDPNDVALGYRLRRAVWGQGYATEGARALIRKGFTELGVQRVFATTYQDNLASRRVMEKAGLKLVRTYRITLADLLATGTFHITSEDLWDGDDVEYALLKADWEQQEAVLHSDKADQALPS